MDPLYQYTNRELYVICQLLRIERVSEYNTKDNFVEAIKNKSDKMLTKVIAELKREKDKNYIIMGYCGKGFNEKSCLDGVSVTYHYYTNDDNFRLKPEGKLGYYSLRKQIVSNTKCETCHKCIVYKGGYINNFNNILDRENTVCLIPKSKKLEPEIVIQEPVKVAKKRVAHDDIINTKSMPKNNVQNSIPQKLIQVDTTVISKKRREEVWNEWIGAEIGVSNCLLCDKVRIQQGACNGWDCGHVKSRKNGGDTSIANLRPICKGCNSSMSDKNMLNYCLKEYPNSKILGTLTNANNVDKKTKLHTDTAKKQENSIEIGVYLSSFTREELRELCSLLGVQHGGQLYQGTNSTKQSIIDKIIKFENNTSKIRKYAQQIRSDKTIEKYPPIVDNMLTQMTVKKLRQLCVILHISLDGNKQDIIHKIMENSSLKNIQSTINLIENKKYFVAHFNYSPNIYHQYYTNENTGDGQCICPVCNKNGHVWHYDNEFYELPVVHESPIKIEEQFSSRNVKSILKNITTSEESAYVSEKNFNCEDQCTFPNYVAGIKPDGSCPAIVEENLTISDLKVEEHQVPPNLPPLPSIPALNMCIICKTKEPNLGYKYCQLCYENKLRTDYHKLNS